MDKPRLCEILGVEVGERFRIKENWPTYYVNESGFLDYVEKEDVVAHGFVAVP